MLRLTHGSQPVAGLPPPPILPGHLCALSALHAQSHEAQALVQEELEARGGAVTSFLPPFTLVLLAPRGPELDWLDELPGVALVRWADPVSGSSSNPRQ